MGDLVVSLVHSSPIVQGLPVLTVLGDSFPSRVGASLYQSFVDHSDDAHSSLLAPLGALLVAHSPRDLEDCAVRLAGRARASQRSANTKQFSAAGRYEVLNGLRSLLGRAVVSKAGLFDTARGVTLFLRGMQSIYEIKLITGKVSLNQKFHVIVL